MIVSLVKGMTGCLILITILFCVGKTVEWSFEIIDRSKNAFVRKIPALLKLVIYFALLWVCVYTFIFFGEIILGK